MVTSTHRTASNDLLGKVAITGGTADQQEVFCTALYHALLHPNLLSDSDGKYWGFDGKVHTVQGTTSSPIRMGLDLQTKHGYLPADGTYPRDFYGSVATLLEYSAQDFATAAFAGALGDTATRDQFANRAQD
ncbi:glycoside hydrolase domain-containing protein [Streptomyces sp. NPDC093094]|uniref:glycoside hydrolase domain-containing protein n=1 Tax=Streptomyces sp. NPDC093094 TaxID=3366026 RepID=UPI003822B763